MSLINTYLKLTKEYSDKYGEKIGRSSGPRPGSSGQEHAQLHP